MPSTRMSLIWNGLEGHAARASKRDDQTGEQFFVHWMDEG
jgi:hypothetical protein